jgi:energy-coupling factor transporter ATP-binding protein EcfA2
MIDKLQLKFGSSVDQQKLEIEITPVTVFVGPNNSGKSRALVELENYCNHTGGQSNDLIINKLTFTAYTKDEIEKELLSIKLTPKSNEQLHDGHLIIGKVGAKTNQAVRINADIKSIIRQAQNPSEISVNCWYSHFVKLFVLRLDGTNRLNLLAEQPAGDFQSSPVNHLANLFTNNNLRNEVRRIIFEAIGKYFVVDPTKPGTLRVRLSDRELCDEREEKGWEEASINFHKAAVEITDSSDGIKAFCGIITTLLAGDPKITLIDEPEAFLHPALANTLGKEIGRSLKDSKKRFFASTHSSSFLMGCIQSGVPLNIIRLTYKNGIPTARLLPKDKILHLMRNPLLRSTGILNGLFYESVIVTEADSDRALLASSDLRGINNCLFINAQNKQTVWDIVKPLRELGIPAAGIVDIDVIKDDGSVFTKPLDGAFIPLLSHASIHGQKEALLNAFKETGKNIKREGGINLLDKSNQEACNNFFNQFEDYGAFVVRNGELESWLKELKVTPNKSTWLIEIFEKMGENPLDINYLKPSEGDVWEFIGHIKKWIDNPNRKGIPE